MKKALFCCFGIILAMWIAVSPAMAQSSLSQEALRQPPILPDQPGLLPTFYDVPDDLVSGTPGSIIRLQSVNAPEVARAWRVVYRSQTGAGLPVAVSGLIVAPKSAKPGANLPVVSWAHGTVGGARYCAPSNVPNPVSDFVGYPSFESTMPNDYGIPGLSAFLKAGYVVVAADYQGLGAGQNHEYAVGLSQARNVLDIVKAARTVTPAGNKVAVLGWSQGGLAALFAGEIASYAPELDLVGIAALAPANPASFVKPEIAKQSTGGPRLGRIILLNRGYTWAYDNLHLSDQLTEKGIKTADAVSRQCIQQLSITADTAGGDEVLLKKLGDNPNAAAAWGARFMENAPGLHPSMAPVLVMQGNKDTVIPQASTDLYVDNACHPKQKSFGNPKISYRKYDGEDHRSLLLAAETDFTEWIANRFENAQEAKSDCPSSEGV